MKADLNRTKEFKPGRQTVRHRPKNTNNGLYMLSRNIYFSPCPSTYRQDQNIASSFIYLVHECSREHLSIASLRWIAVILSPAGRNQDEAAARKPPGLEVYSPYLPPLFTSRRNLDMLPQHHAFPFKTWRPRRFKDLCSPNIALGSNALSPVLNSNRIQFRRKHNIVKYHLVQQNRPRNFFLITEDLS